MKKNFKSNIAILLSVSLLLIDPVFGARGENEDGTPVTTTTLPQQGSTSTTMPSTEETYIGQLPTVQTSAKKASGNNTLGILLGVGAAAYCGKVIGATCPPCFSTGTTCGQCYLHIAGLAASALVIVQMTKAKDESNATCDAVSTSSCTIGYNSGVTGGNGGSTAGGTDSYTNDPTDPRNSDDYRTIQATITDLERRGFEINQSTGTVKFPNGRTISAADMGNSRALSAAGIDPNAFASMMDQAQKAGEKYASTKGTDNNSDMFGDALGGGGGSAGTADSGGLGGSGLAGREKLGVNRDPAQVAGMSVQYNGESIGVGPDNLFKMIHRRYNLHEQKGNFVGGK